MASRLHEVFARWQCHVEIDWGRRAIPDVSNPTREERNENDRREGGAGRHRRHVEPQLKAGPSPSASSSVATAPACTSTSSTRSSSSAAPVTGTAVPRKRKLPRYNKDLVLIREDEGQTEGEGNPARPTISGIRSILTVLLFLSDTRDIVRVATVARSWRVIAIGDRIWEAAFKRDGLEKRAKQVRRVEWCVA